MDKITTTVVAIGDGKDVPMLRQLAAAGGGRFYLAKRARQLPAIFTQDAAIMSRSAIEEGRFFPKVQAGEEILRGIDSLPALLAYCLTDSRPLSRVGMRTHKDDPLLATWQYGLGTSLAFTSDAQSRWAQAWVGWEGFAAFWSQAVRAISRKATTNNYQVAVRQEGGKGMIEMRGYDRLGNPLSDESATVRIAAPDGSSKEVTLNQQAPGVYEGSFESSALGSYVVTVSEKDPSGAIRVSSSGFSVPYPPEYRSFRPNRPLLDQIAKRTQGMELKEPQQALRPVPNPGSSITELWPMLVLFAALLIPIDVGVRRLAIPLAEALAKVWARIRQRKEAVVAQTEVVDRLHQAKQRARTQSNGSPMEVPHPVAAEPVDRVPVKRVPASSASASAGLLEAKRRRNEEAKSD
jgi:Ca-activated chloride channel family protein